MVTEQEAVTAAESFEWVWVVRKVNNREGEKVPMEVGDMLYICVCETGKAQFRQRSKVNRENSKLWDGATGDYCAETGTVSGTLADQRTFKMRVAPGKGCNTIISEHKRNPDEGDWEGDDGWDPTQA